MTSKATLLSDSQLKLAGYRELLPREPLKEGEQKRAIWTSQDVFDLLKGNNPGVHFPSLAADTFIGRFCKGWIVNVSRREKSKAEFKWFVGHDEVWVWSFRSPAPGWRIIGRFARKNVFIAIVAYDRFELADKVTYHGKAAEIPMKWEEKFPGVEPFRGKDFGDYLGEMHRNDDE